MKTEIEKLDHYGRGLAHIENKVYFIDNALPHEIVEYKIVKDTKKYTLATATKILKESAYRIPSTCPCSNICGACSLRNLSFVKENEFKQEKVVELLSKMVDGSKELVKDIIYTNPDNYRNKVVFHVKDKKLGYYEEKTNKLIEIDNCLLLNSRINELFPTLKEVVKENDLSEIVIRTSNDNSKVMVKLIGNIQNYSKLLNVVDVLMLNDQTVTSDSSIITNIGNYKYYVSLDSFFQVNETLTEKLYDKVRDYVKEISPSNTLDLYCGTGTIGIYVSKYTNHVLGIDCNQSNILDANKNKELNKVENIEFIASKVEDVIENIKDKYDLIIVDPPRAGLDPKTIKTIKEMSPINIIYVSCDPVTLMRDLNILKEHYNIVEITPFNMFPRTYHVECVSVLSRKA